jgi:hypothetical protein
MKYKNNRKTYEGQKFCGCFYTCGYPGNDMYKGVCQGVIKDGGLFKLSS